MKTAYPETEGKIHEGEHTMNGRKVVKSIGVSAVLLGMSVFSTSAFAAGNSATFSAHYQANANVEAGLLQKAQAGMAGQSSATLTQLQSTVSAIQTQVAALYTAEQALAVAGTSIPAGGTTWQTASSSQLALRGRLMAAIAKDRSALRGHHAEWWRKQETGRLQSAQRALQLLNGRLDAQSKASVMWRTHPYDGALTQLQSSIFALQHAAEHYTNVWIALESTTTTVNVPASVTGLAYASSTITVPPTGSSFAADAVATAPIVKDAAGNILNGQGSYTITGPSGYTGVMIDAVSGEVTVSPGATAGGYTVTYSQGTVTESVYLTVIQ